MLVLSQASDFQKMVMWTKHFLRSLTQVPTPSIYALWPDSVNLIHARSLWKQFRGMFSCEQKRTEGVLFGFIDASSARYHARGWETVTVLSSSNLFPLFQSSLKLQPVLGEVWYLRFTYNFHELKLIGRNSIQTGFFTAKPFLLLEAGPCPTCDDLKCQWQKGVTDHNTQSAKLKRFPLHTTVAI